MSVKESRQDKMFQEQGNVHMLELDRIIRCKYCNAQEILCTIYCWCGKLMPNIKAEIDHRIKQDTQGCFLAPCCSQGT